MTNRFLIATSVALCAVLVLLAALPQFANRYAVSLASAILSYVILATAWAMFSRPTRDVSLATAAFFGIGAYVTAGLATSVPLPLVVLIAGTAGRLTYIDQKRLELSRALATQPSLLLLDEWRAGLNPAELALGIDLVQTIGQSGVTMILVEHVMLAVRTLCDRVIVMDAGSKVAEGKPDAVLANPEVVRAYLGDDDA